MKAKPNDPVTENAPVQKSPDNVLVKMMKRKKVVQQHIRDGRVEELDEKGIKVVQPI